MKRKQDSDPWAVAWTVRGLVIITFLAAFTVPTGLLPIVAIATDVAGELTQVEGPITIALSTPEPTATPVPPEPAATPTPHVPQIGIIAGHMGSDSGAVCDDGLQEVDINLNVAQQVVAMAIDYGWEAQLLEEFDVRLNGYKADVLLSIHADSCNVPGRSGFKMARAESSYIPGAEDRLVECVSRNYAEATGLLFDAYTITYDMTRYHAYYEIDPGTPAAILETGFMLEDRELLTEGSGIVAQGIFDGLICFIEGRDP
ncbi:MAG: N-acetylmuramoyl-L-alanine amidase [Anaerolineae bacterium]|nr:N-acetylmuramoyl-L-alanine amidase [Anaerolineae bacterium]